MKLWRLIGDHLNRFTQAGALALINRACPIITLTIIIIVGMNRNDTNIDGHIISQVLIARNKGCASFIFETNTTGSPIIYTIEVLDRSHNRVRRVMGKDLNSHWNARSYFWVFIKEQLERDVFGLKGGRR